MIHIRIVGFVASAMACLCAAAASAQNLAGAYRGMIVCEQVKGAADILHVPLDLAIRGNDVQFARPLFNLQGTRVLGSELGSGTVDADGKLHLASAWDFRGIAVKGEYSGTLTLNGGTLTGTQTWQGGDGVRGSRTCTAALVPAPKSRDATADEHD